MNAQRYRKKPVLVWARRYTGDDVSVAWVNFNGGRSRTEFRGRPKERVLVIETLEGDMTAQQGDWIIQGVKGEFYPIKPDIFEATYEPAPDGGDA